MQRYQDGGGSDAAVLGSADGAAASQKLMLDNARVPLGRAALLTLQSWQIYAHYTEAGLRTHKKKKKKVTDSQRFCLQKFPWNISQAPGDLNSLEINGKAMIGDLIGCCLFDSFMKANVMISMVFKCRASFGRWMTSGV